MSTSRTRGLEADRNVRPTRKGRQECPPTGIGQGMYMTRVAQVPPLPPRPVEGHKGLFGRVLVVGGNEDMIGAPVFAGTAALRLGSGWVQIAVPRSNLAICLSITPELVGLGLGTASAEKALTSAAEKADAIVLGPGLG